MDNAKDSGTRADAKAGDQDGKGGKARVTAQGTNGVAEVLQEVGEGHGLALDGGLAVFV